MAERETQIAEGRLPEGLPWAGHIGVILDENRRIRWGGLHRSAVGIVTIEADEKWIARSGCSGLVGEVKCGECVALLQEVGYFGEGLFASPANLGVAMK